MHEFVSVTLSRFLEGSLNYPAGAAAVVAAVAFRSEVTDVRPSLVPATAAAAAQKTHSNPREIHTYTHTWSNISSHIQCFVSSFLPLLQFRETQTGFHPRWAAADFSFHFITTAKLLEKREKQSSPSSTRPSSQLFIWKMPSFIRVF